jgi:hypothetical protein
VEYVQFGVRTNKYPVQKDIALGSIDRLNALLTPCGFVAHSTVDARERANLLLGGLLVADSVKNKP